MLFDNGHWRSKIKENYVAAKDNFSRGVRYRIDTEKMEIEQIWYGSTGKNAVRNSSLHISATWNTTTKVTTWYTPAVSAMKMANHAKVWL